MTWEVVSPLGFSSMGFMWASGFFSPAALAWRVWIIAISDPERVTLELRLMFWLLNGATRNPFLWRILHIAATVTDLPASDVAPTTMSARPGRKNLSLADARMSLKRGSPASVIPRRSISESTYFTTGVRWMNRQSEQFQSVLPRLPTRKSPRSVSSHG